MIDAKYTQFNNNNKTISLICRSALSVFICYLWSLVSCQLCSSCHCTTTVCSVHCALCGHSIKNIILLFFILWCNCVIVSSDYSDSVVGRSQHYIFSPLMSIVYYSKTFCFMTYRRALSCSKYYTN